MLIRRGGRLPFVFPPLAINICVLPVPSVPRPLCAVAAAAADLHIASACSYHANPATKVGILDVR